MIIFSLFIFRHAEVYTTELVTKITTEKLMRLRTLYIDQLYRLKHLLREKRRSYLHTLRSERETLSSIHDQPKDTIYERKLYRKLKALNKYQKRNGVEAILYKKFLEKRQRVCVHPHIDSVSSFMTEKCFIFLSIESRRSFTSATQAFIPYSMHFHRRRR